MPYLLAIVGVAGLVLYVRAIGAAEASRRAVHAVDDLAGGLLTGAGEVIGIPATSKAACEKAKAAGDTWEASFACTAKDFVTWWWEK